MLRQLMVSSSLACAVACFCSAAANATIVRFETNVGNIDFRLFDSAAPENVANFLSYVTSGTYDGTFIHQSLDSPPGVNFAIAGGGFQLNNDINAAEPIAVNAPVEDEVVLPNLTGTLAAVKQAGPDSATSIWQLNLSDNSSLDPPAANPLSVFGKVIGNGLDTAVSIATLPIFNGADAEDQPGEHYDSIPVLSILDVVTSGGLRDDNVVVLESASVLSISAGDFDRDAMVAASDYALWRQDFGSTVAVESDGNGSGRVDLADYTVWRDDLAGSQALPGAASVPEPASLVILSIAALAVLGRRSAASRNP